MKIGTPEDRAAFIGPVIDETALERYDSIVRSARQVGRIVHGGTPFRTGRLARGLFVEPAIVTDLPCDHWLNREEVFLPFLWSRPATGWRTRSILGNSVNYGLAAGLYSEDPDEIELFKTKAEAGVLYVNRAPGRQPEHGRVSKFLWLERFGRGRQRRARPVDHTALHARARTCRLMHAT